MTAPGGEGGRRAGPAGRPDQPRRAGRERLRQPTPPTDRYAFFLGGRDLEMDTIRALLHEFVEPERIQDKRLPWGAKASAYRQEIVEAARNDMIPVLIELEPDIDRLPRGSIVIDHHGEAAGRDKPTSLQQLFKLLDLPRSRWDRWLELVSTNDRGHIAELRRFGASEEEIRGVRKADREAQGVTDEQEEQGKRALSRRRTLFGGALVFTELPHARTAVVVDPLEENAQCGTPVNVLVQTSESLEFSGVGAAVDALDRAFPGGWKGGALPDRGFWGHGAPLPSVAAAIEVLRQILAPGARPPKR